VVRENQAVDQNTVWIPVRRYQKEEGPLDR
jgi:hypothetical protein